MVGVVAECEWRPNEAAGSTVGAPCARRPGEGGGAARDGEEEEEEGEEEEEEDRWEQCGSGAPALQMQAWATQAAQGECYALALRAL